MSVQLTVTVCLGIGGSACRARQLRSSAKGSACDAAPPETCHAFTDTVTSLCNTTAAGTAWRAPRSGASAPQSARSTCASSRRDSRQRPSRVQQGGVRVMAHTAKDAVWLGCGAQQLSERGRHICIRGTLMAPEQENGRGRLPVAACSTTCSADNFRGPTMCSSAALSACKHCVLDLRRLNIVNSSKQVAHTVRDAMLEKDAADESVQVVVTYSR